MRIVSWNIQHGGTGREKAIASALVRHEPDLAVLLEYSPDRSAALRERLLSEGFRWAHSAESTETPPRVLIASTVELEAVPPSPSDLELSNRWAEVRLPSYHLRLAGVYVPVTGSRAARKRRMWQSVHHAAEMRTGEPYMIIGDWNTGDFPADKSHPTRPFRFTNEYRKLVEFGYVEAWRHLHPDASEYSWYHNDGKGFRIDHAFVSPALLPRLSDCRYSHQERIAGISDHSILIVDLCHKL